MAPHPVVAVGAVVLHGGKALLVRRANEPLRGRWVVPGGRVEWGERLSEAVVREVLEETGLHVHPREILLVVDHLDGDPVQSHLVIVDYRCDYVGGTLRSGSDAEGAVWAAPDEFDRYDVPAPVREVIGRAIEGLPRPVPGGTLLK